MEESFDLDLVNEKIHPRKRLKGRKGFRKAGGKGSHRKVYRGKESHNMQFSDYINKHNNSLFQSHEETKNEIDDGGIETVPSLKRWSIKYQRYLPISYSVNKKKRWLLKEKLDKEGGYHSHLRNNFHKIQEQMEESGKNVSKSLEEKYRSKMEELDELNQWKMSRRHGKKMKKKKRLKRLRKLPKYQLDEQSEKYEVMNREVSRYNGIGNYYGVYRTNQRNRLQDLKGFKREHDRRRIKKRDRKFEIRVENEKRESLTSDIEHIKKEFEDAKEEYFCSKKNKKNKKYHKNRRKRRLEKETEDEAKRMEREKMKEIITSNPYYYEFGTVKKPSLKKWGRKPRNKCNDEYTKMARTGREKRRQLKTDVRDSLSFKY